MVYYGIVRATASLSFPTSARLIQLYSQASAYQQMSIFDPFGLLQQIWRSGIGWDDQLEDGARKKWLKWLNNLSTITDVRVTRCYSANLRSCDQVELHVFCDASTIAMNAVAYLRVVKAEKIDVSFVASRGRVAPERFMSIPKLELQAALLGYRFSLMIKEEMGVKVHKTVYWIDSRTVLCWLKTRKALKTFVATMVANDHAFEADIDEFCSETRVVNTVMESESILPDVNRFSQWRRLIRSTAYVRKFIDMCKRKSSIKQIQPCEEQRAICLWLKAVQNEQFPEDYTVLMNRGELKPSSKLKSLAPLLDNEGIMRVGGRLNMANVKPGVKNPIILGASGRFVSLLVQNYHQEAHHQGRELVLNEIRQTYWIIGL